MVGRVCWIRYSERGIFWGPGVGLCKLDGRGECFEKEDLHDGGPRACLILTLR